MGERERTQEYGNEIHILSPSFKKTQPYLVIIIHNYSIYRYICVISTLQQLTLEGAASTQGHALSVGKERKMTAHSEACRSVGVIFLPLVVESLGGWDGEAADIIRAIGRLQGQRLGIPPAEATRHFFQRLAVSLWRGNAALWIGRLPTRSPELDGII